jgi:hypothetical protein
LPEISKEKPALAAMKTVLPGNRYKIRSNAEALVTAGPSPASDAVDRLPPGTIVLSAEVLFDDGGEQVRISAPAGWLSARHLEPAGPAVSLQLDFNVFAQMHEQVAPGDEYGLAFPITIEMLRAFGPEFLTAAFRAAGTISADNAVREWLDGMTPGEVCRRIVAQVL